MEIDFSDVKIHRNIPLIVAFSAITLVILGMVGWFILPDGRVLTWSEWQVFQQHQQYRNEVAVLTRNANALGELASQPRDPVRAQLLAEKITGDLDGVSLAALAGPKAELLTAVDAALQWSLGSGELPLVLERIEAANQAIARSLELIAQPVETATPAPTDG